VQVIDPSLLEIAKQGAEAEILQCHIEGVGNPPMFTTDGKLYGIFQPSKKTAKKLKTSRRPPEKQPEDSETNENKESVISSVWADIVKAVHAALVIYIVGAPFICSNFMLTFYVVVVPFIVVHWITNNNKCILTVMEKKLREANGDKCDSHEDTFLGKLITPVYDVHKHSSKAVSKAIYVGTFLLWGFACYRLLKTYQHEGYVALFLPSDYKKHLQPTSVFQKKIDQNGGYERHLLFGK
jgi:hypothetical protein